MKQVGKRKIRRMVTRALGGLAVGAFFFAAGAANAQSYPTRPIKIVVPWTAGGVTDAVTRALAQGMSDRMSVAVIVDNKGGAAGTIGATAVANSPADGYTLLMASSETHTIAPNLRPKLPYAPLKDFVPLMPYAIVPFALVARPDFPANTLAELIALVKKNPGKFSYASPGQGSTSQVAMEVLKVLADLDVLHVPYANQPQALLALTSGQTDLQMVAAGQAASAAHGPRSLKVIAVTTRQRVADLPDVPTFREAGLPGMNFSNWLGLVAPAGLPAPIAQRLAAEMAATMKTAEMKNTLHKLGLQEVDPSMPPPEFSKFLESETARWATVIRGANIKAD